MVNIKKHYIKALLTSLVIIAVIGSISLYDSEAFTKPFIDYSQAETLIPLDSMWEEESTDTESDISDAIITSSEIVSTTTDEIVPSAESTVTTESTTAVTTTEITTVEANLSESTTTESTEQNGLININKAGIEELKQLNGVGDVIAKRIIDYARTIGFKSIDEIKNVKGIGDKKYEQMKDKITV